MLFGHKSPPKTVDFVLGIVFGVKDAGLGEELVHILWVAGYMRPVALQQCVGKLLGSELEDLFVADLSRLEEGHHQFDNRVGRRNFRLLVQP